MRLNWERPGGPDGNPLGKMWLSALFWAAGSTYVFAWGVSYLAFLHYEIDPDTAEILWSGFWDQDHPLTYFYWGIVLLLCAAGLWKWMGYKGVRQKAAARGGLGGLMLCMCAGAIVVYWLAATLINVVAVIVTGNENLVMEKPEYAVEMTILHLPAMLFTAVIAAPVFEELAFRGFLLSVLLARGWPMGISIALVAALFAVMHYQYYVWGQLSVFVFGVLMGYLRVASGGIAAPILAHAAANLLLTLMSFAEQSA